MFKSSLVFLTGTLVAVSMASAADLPMRAAPPPMIPLAPVFTWTGFYVGATVGAAFDNSGGSNSVFYPLGSIAGSEGTNGTLSLNGKKGDDVSFTGGGTIGYNYQFGGSAASGVVVGLEADAQYLSFGNRSGTTNYTFAPLSPFGAPANGLAFADPSATVVRRGARDIDYFGTVRGRIGYAFNQYLVYATGGLAYGGGDTDLGYTVGGGLEYAISRNLSVKVEGLYVNLDTKISGAGTSVYNVATNTLTVTDRNRSQDFEVARVGINYRF